MISAEMIDRMVASEAEYTAIRAKVIGRWPDNRFGVALHKIGSAHGFQVKGVPSPWLNRVLGLEDAEAVHVWHDWFANAGIAGRFETLPHQFSPELGCALIAAGLSPIGGDALVCGRPAPASRIEAIEHAETSEAIEVFLDTHLDGLGVPIAVRDGAKKNMRGWRGLPGWHLLLVRRDGAPAGSCVLFQRDGVAYIADMATRPEFRNRGVQTALLAQCHMLTVRADIMWARCRYLSQSHRNLMRAGLELACTSQFWQ